MTKLIAFVLCDKAARLIIHTWVFKLLNQPIRPSSSTNLTGHLQCGRAIRGHRQMVVSSHGVFNAYLFHIKLAESPE